MDWTKLFSYITWWVYFGILHSFLANQSIKDKMPIKGKLYRISYNIISTIVLFIVLSKQPSITSLIYDGLNSSGFQLILFIVPVLLGSLIASLGLLQWDILAFIGLKDDPKELDTTKIFAFARHPVYTGAILLFSAPLFLGLDAINFAWICGAGGYFVIGTWFEERNLMKYFEEYSIYKQNVGRFFPWRMNHIKYLVKSFN